MRNRFLSALTLALTLFSCQPPTPACAAAFTVADNYAPLRYTATASQTTFSVTWPFEQEEDLVVKVDAGATGTFATKTLATDYTTTGESTTNGGTVVFGTGLSAGDIVVITRDSGVTDGTDFGASVTTSALNLRFDQYALALQEVESDVEKRALMLPETEPFATVSPALPSASASAGKLLAYKSDGSGFEAVTSSLNGSSPTTVAGGTYASPGTPIVLRNGSTATREAVTLNTGECTYDTDRNAIYCGDGATAGGLPVGMDVFNVESYGVDCAAGTDDYAGMAAAIDAAEANSGGVIYTSAGCIVDLAVQTQDTPIFTLSSDDLTFWSYGATFKVSATASTAPSTLINEQFNGFVFKAIAKTGVTFLGGTFDGDRDNATQDPRYGFAICIACEGTTVRDMFFKNCQNDRGAFTYDDYDNDTAYAGKTKHFTFENNRVDQCANGFRSRGAFEYTKILNNKFTHLDLAMYDTNLGPAIADPYGTVVTVRGIGVVGFSSNLSYETAGPCIGLQISGNEILGSSWGIELYNGNNTNGDDPSEFRDVTLTNNRLWTTSGFNTNYMNNVVLSGNTWRGLTDIEYAAYGGRRYQYGGSDPTSAERAVEGTIAVAGTSGEFTCSIASELSVEDLVSVSGTAGGTGSITGYSDYTNYRVSAVDVNDAATTFTLTDPDGNAIVTTAGTLSGLTFRIVRVSFGIFLEGTPTYDMVVSDNVIDGGWRPNASNGSKTGVAIGWNSAAVPGKPNGLVVANNIFHNLYLGLQLSQVENATISGNYFDNNRTNIASLADSSTARVADASMTWAQNSLIGNVLITAEDGDAANTSLQGDWTISGNTFIGQESMLSGQPLLTLKGFETTGTPSADADLSNFIITGNTFKRFQYSAISDSSTTSAETINVWVDGNFFDSEDASPSSLQSAYKVRRNTTVDKTVRFGRNTIRNIFNPITVTDEANGGLTEDYNFGTWDADSNMTRAIADHVGSTGFTNSPPVVGFGPNRRYQLLNLADGLTATGLLPASSEIHGVSVKVTGDASGTSVTSLKVGDGSTADLWGKVVGLSANSDNSDISDGTNGWSATARYFTGDAGGDVVIGGNGGTPTAGVVAIMVDYTKMLGDLPGSAD
jgi:hypothetical protein